MATVLNLHAKIQAYEADTRALLADDDASRFAHQAGALGAKMVAEMTLLDLAVKGVIPDGLVGRLIEAVSHAIEESSKRITGE